MKHFYLRTFEESPQHPGEIAWLMTTAEDAKLTSGSRCFAGRAPVQDDLDYTVPVILADVETAICQYLAETRWATLPLF